jgi:hypothetical protein
MADVLSPGGRSTFRPLLLVAAGAAVVLFLISSLAAFSQTDFMYVVAPAVLKQNGALYTDVPFPQAPLSVLLYVFLAHLTGSVNVFVPARLSALVCVVAAVLLPTLSRPRLRERDIWLLYVALCLSNFYIASNGREAASYALALLCLSAAVTAADSAWPPAWRAFAACACVALAACAKLYFVVIWPGVFLYVLLRAWPLRWQTIAACALGFIVGLAPILFYLARDFGGFWHWNVRFHELVLSSRLSDRAAHLDQINTWLKEFGLQMLIPAALVAGATWAAVRQGGAAIRAQGATLALLFFGAVMAVSPLSLYAEYLAPIAFLLFLFSVPWQGDDRARSTYLMFGGVLLCFQLVLMGQGIARLLLRDGIALTQVLRTQAKAHRVIGKDYLCERKLYSPEPLFLLGGAKYPPELAAGPYVMSLRSESAMGGDDPQFIARIEAWNPDVVIWGYFLGGPDRGNDAVDRMTRDYALAHNFTVVPLGRVAGHAIELAYRPGCKSS